MNKKSIIESLLYLKGKDGVELSEIKRILEIPTDEIRTIIKEMEKSKNEDENSGLTIKNYGSKYYLLTKSENHQEIIKLLNIKNKNPLTNSIMEVLAIIAYNSPCTKTKVDQVRGVDSYNAIEKLISLGLIEKAGRAETPGNPYLYTTNQKFYNLFGLKSIKDLPSIEISTLDYSNNINDFFDSNRMDEEE